MNDREKWQERSGISVLAARHDDDDDLLDNAWEFFLNANFILSVGLFFNNIYSVTRI